MLSAPAPYPTVSSSIPAPDDAQIVPSHRLPSICVDYLSHNWARDEDVWNSWKAMTKSKNEIANGVRLENASWRTWMKQMRNLKTVSPETLNWLKDSDVTWLYGPLHQGQVEAVPAAKVATTADRLDLEATRPPAKNAHSASAPSLPRSKMASKAAAGQDGRASPPPAAAPGSSPSPVNPSTTAATISSPPPAAGGQAAASSVASGPPVLKKTPSPQRVNSDGSAAPFATKSILKHRTIQDLLGNPQANSAAGVGSALGLRSASQPSLPELEAAAAATSLALREGSGEAVLSPGQARALGLGMGAGSSGGGLLSPDLASDSTGVLSSSPSSGVVSPSADQPAGSSHLGGGADSDTASASLKSPTASAASLASLSSVGSAGTPTTERSSHINLSGAAGSAAAAAAAAAAQKRPERRHISFNQRVEQCIALDMDQVQEYSSSDEDGQGGYGAHRQHQYGHHQHHDDDDDEEESVMWRSGPGQRVQRRQRFEDDDEDEMLTINVRSSSSLGRPSSSSGGSSTSATSYSVRSRSSGTHGGSGRAPHHSHHPRTIAKLAPTMLRGGSAQPETGEWLDHEESDAHDVDIHAGVGPSVVQAGVGTGPNAHVPAYVHNPIVNVDRQQHGDLGYDGHGRDVDEEEHKDGLGGDDGGRGRASEPMRAYGASSSSYSGRVHQSGRQQQSHSSSHHHNQHQHQSASATYGSAGNDSYDVGSDGGSDWENRTSLDLGSPTFLASPAAEDLDGEHWEHASGGGGGGAGGRGVSADEVARRTKSRRGKDGKASSSSVHGGGGNGRGSGSRSGQDGSFWADADGHDGGGLHGKGRRGGGGGRDEPGSPASTSSSSSFSASSKRIGGGGGGGGERRRQSSTEVALEDRAVHGALSIDVDNVPSNDPNSPVNPAHGPTPLNTPTFLLGGKPGKGASKSAQAASGKAQRGSQRRSHGRSGSGAGSGSASAASQSQSTFDDEDDEDEYDPAMAVLPHRRTSTGALVAPKNRQVQVPLAHDYVDEGDEGGLINRAVEMINTARDLFGALWGAGDSDRGRSWRDSTYDYSS